MHDPYECYPILKLSSPLDAFGAFGTPSDDTLLVGSKPGHLIRYSVKPKSLDQKLDVQLLRYSKNFCKKSIQQLDVIPQLNLLIILAENMVCVHDITSMNAPLISTVHRTRGATLYTLDIEVFDLRCQSAAFVKQKKGGLETKRNHTDESLTREASYFLRMCVVVKKKLQLYYWKNNDFLVFCEDIIVSDVPKSIALCKQSICVGLRNEYIFLKIEDSKEQKELFPSGRNVEPNVIKFDNSTFALLRESQSVFVDVTGKLLTKVAVKWTEMPHALLYDEPYFIALLSESIEIRTVQPALLVQTIKTEKPQFICRSMSKQLYVGSGIHISIIQAVPVAKQIKFLIDEKQFQLALKLCNVSDDKDEEKVKKRYQIQALYAYDLFNSKQFSESMKQFLELDIDPYDVIRLFPFLLPQYSQDDSPVSDNVSGRIPDRDLEKSLPALIEYLTAARLKLFNSKNKKSVAELEQTFQIIDTTLLKCYLHTNDALVAPLIRLNNCHVLDSEKALRKHKKISELILLYETKGLHHRALELLQKQAEQSDNPISEVEKMIQYLQRLGQDNIDLIFRFSGWVLNNYPEQGLLIFTDDAHEVLNLPRLRILEFILKTNKSLTIPYLEHCVNVWKDTDSNIHNALAHQYREKIIEVRNSPDIPHDMSAEKNIRKKLIEFLEKSNYYSAESLCTHFPFDSLFEERAILLSKLGQHERALAIYITVLYDTAKAIQYCDSVYKKGGPDSDQVYVYLLKHLINPPDSSLLGAIPSTQPKPDIDMALTLLEGNATRIPAEKILKIIPKDIPIYKVKHFLSVNLSEHLSRRRRCQITRGLTYSEHLQIQELRIRFESQVITLNELSICAVCNKRFSKQCAFFRNPNGDLIHLSCHQSLPSK